MLQSKKSYKQIFIDSLSIWDKYSSHQLITINGNEITKEEGEYGLTTAFTKDGFLLGKENYLFVLELRICNTYTVGGYLYSIGISSLGS